MITGTAHAERVVAAYDYTDEESALLFQVVRFETEDGSKDFRQRRPDGNGGWTWGLGDARRVLYRLPKVVAAASNGDRIVVVEGEKDVETLEERGYTATCNPMGSGKWIPEYAEPLREARVVIVADRDEPGHRHAAQVAASLKGIAASVHIFECPDHKDISDHLGAGRQLRELVPIYPTLPTPEPPKRRSSWKPPPGGDDAARLKAIPAAVYFEKLTGEPVPERGRWAGKVRCPAHDERTPSCHVGGGDETKWHCFGCAAGGSVIDLAALLWDIEPRGDGFKELVDRLADIFLGGRSS